MIKGTATVKRVIFGLISPFVVRSIRVGFLRVHFAGGGGGEGAGVRGKITPCLKLFRIMLETWNLVRKYTHIISFRKYTF